MLRCFDGTGLYLSGPGETGCSEQSDLYGDINGHLISQHRDEKDWFPYTLTFRRVLAYFACELDTYENLAGMGHLDGSSFDLIEDSTWLKSLPVREDFDKDIYRHYRLFTYDDVYYIIAVSYEFAAEL